MWRCSQRAPVILCRADHQPAPTVHRRSFHKGRRADYLTGPQWPGPAATTTVPCGCEKNNDAVSPSVTMARQRRQVVRYGGIAAGMAAFAMGGGWLVLHSTISSPTSEMTAPAVSRHREPRAALYYLILRGLLPVSHLLAGWTS